MMRHLMLFALLIGGTAMLTGCVNLRIGTDEDIPRFEMDGAGSAYGTYSGIDNYDGTLAHLRLFSSEEETGELISLGIWPLMQLDLGLLGARAKVLGAEAGAGTLFYTPEPLSGNISPGGSVDVNIETQTSR